MPVPVSMSAPMLSTFKNMMKEVDKKGYSGEAVDAMRQTLTTMESYAREMNDFSAFSARLMTENLFFIFSDHYSKVLTAAAMQKYNLDGPYTDSTDQLLLKDAIDALKTAIQSITDSKEKVRILLGEHGKDVDVLFKDKYFKDGIQKSIDLGESGINYPTYLRKQVEMNLDKAMEGGSAVREGLVYLHDLDSAIAMHPFGPEKSKKHLEIFDKMALEAPFGSPNTLVFQLACNRIDWEIEPEILKWEAISDRFYNLLNDLWLWARAHSPNAIDEWPWSEASDKQRAVDMTKDCTPGELQVKLELLQRNFGISFYDIFSHEVFIYEVKNHFQFFSQAAITYIVDEVYPQCKPFQYLPQPAIDTVVEMQQKNVHGNPETHLPAEKFAKVFNEYFGKGEYQKRFKSIEKTESNAQPWNLNTFEIKS